MDAQEVKALIRRMNAAKLFPANTCAASRHAEMIADNLLHQRPHAVEDMQHCGESIAVTVAALWEARTEVERLTKERDRLQYAITGPGGYSECAIKAQAEIAEITAERDEDQGVIAVWRGRTQRAEAERDEAVAAKRVAEINLGAALETALDIQRECEEAVALLRDIADNAWAAAHLSDSQIARMNALLARRDV